MKAYITKIEILDDDDETLLASLELFDDAWHVKIDQVLSGDSLIEIGKLLNSDIHKPIKGQ